MAAIIAKYEGTCPTCKAGIKVGKRIVMADGKAHHEFCAPKPAATSRAIPTAKKPAAKFEKMGWMCSHPNCLEPATMRASTGQSCPRHYDDLS